MTLHVASTPVKVAIAASATKTILGINAGATAPLRIKEVSISFDAVDANQVPVQVELLRHSSAGTSTALTVVENEEVRPSPAATAGYNYTVEPTAGDVLRRWFLTPAGGLWAIQFPLGDEIVVAPSGRISLRAITIGGVSCNALANIVFDE